jgi:hypothetical protein
MSSHQTYIINSSNRISGTHNSFNYRFDPPISDKFNHVTVLQANIPKSFWLVPAGFNTFTLQEGTDNFTITMPVGNYSRASFATVLTTAINDSGNYTYSVSYETAPAQETGLYIYSVSGNSGTQHKFILGDNLYEQLGFNPNSTVTFVADSLTSTNVIKLTTEDTIVIRSDCVQHFQDGANILQIIYSQSSVNFGTIVYSNPSPEINSKPLASHSGVYSFQLTNENGEPIDLNGLNWTMELCVYHNDELEQARARELNILSQKYQAIKELSSLKQ